MSRQCHGLLSRSQGSVCAVVTGLNFSYDFSLLERITIGGALIQSDWLSAERVGEVTSALEQW